MDISMNTSSAANYMVPPNASALQSGLTGLASSVISPITEHVTKTVESSAISALVANEPPKMDVLKALVVEGNALFKNVNSNLLFQIDDSTNQVVVKIVDSKTGELVRQIPTVEMLDFIRRMKELEGNAGAVLSKKV